jgi:hypothetical protein
MDDETFAFWRGWKDARAGFPPQNEEHAEPDAYRTGYEHGSARRSPEEAAA